MRQQNVVARPHQLSAIAGLLRQPFRVGDPMPLPDEPLAVLLVWRGQSSHCLLQRGMVSFTDAKGHGKNPRTVLPGSSRTRTAQVQLPDQGNIPVGGRTKLPVHAKIFDYVAPAVARAHKSATYA